MSGARLEYEALPVVSAAQLDQSTPEQRWLVETLWGAEAVGVIGGTPKSFKTWLGLEIAVSVASGTPCLGEFGVARPGPALIYLAEDSATVVRERLAALCAHRQVDLETLDVRVITVPTLRLDCEDDVRRLGATLRAHEPALLLLDPFVRMHVADENSAQAVASILAQLRDLQRTHQVAIIVVHHTRKNVRGGQHGQSLRGSGDFHAWVDSGLYITHEKQRLRLTIEHRAAPAPEPVYIDLVGQPPHLELVSAPDSEPSLEDRVLAALRRSEEPLRRTTLRSLLAINNTRLGDALAHLEQLGRVHRTPQGWAA